MSTTMPDRSARKDPPPAATIRVYSTLSRTKQPLATVRPGQVGIYLCGPTVYDKAHIGHMVGPVIFDTIKRYLVYSGYQVTWVVNITDVDDKLIMRSRERGIPMPQLAEEMTADYLSNLAGMGVDQIDHMPKATECMAEIIAFTQALVDRGFAYEADGDVFFDVAKNPQYGKLTNRTVDALQGEGGEAVARKRSAADFALWKRAKPGEPSWDSPWGPGRPGWHIECSAMSRGLLGETFDIHGGGLDLIFPHHENEIAQSECCHGKPMARYWLHNGLLRASAQAGKIGGRGDRTDETATAAEPTPSAGEPRASARGSAMEAAKAQKMSRSQGAGGLADLIARQGGEQIRFFLLRTHYRSTVLFSEDAIAEAATGLETFYRLLKRIERVTGQNFYLLSAADRASGNLDPGGSTLLKAVHQIRERFLAAMDDDFNTGGAIGELFELARTINKYIDDEHLETDHAGDAGRLVTLSQAVGTLRELSATLGLFLKPQGETDSAGDSEHKRNALKALLDTNVVLTLIANHLDTKKIRQDVENAAASEVTSISATELAKQLSVSLETIMNRLIEARIIARKSKDFATADNIRAAVAAAGISLADRPGGTEWTLSE